MTKSGPGNTRTPPLWPGIALAPTAAPPPHMAVAMTDLICAAKQDGGGLIAPGAVGPALLRVSPFFDLLDPARPAAGAA